jgi:hypothetical protein
MSPGAQLGAICLSIFGWTLLPGCQSSVGPSLGESQAIPGAAGGSGGAAGAAGAGGDAGTDGGIPLGLPQPTGPVSCPALDHITHDEAKNSPPPPALCTQPQPAACPAEPPTPGTPCTAGMSCRYPITDNDFSFLSTCDPQSATWPKEAVSCGRLYPPPLADDFLPGVACGSQPDIGCGPDSDQNWGDLVLLEAAECCNIGLEVGVHMKLEDGCGTAVQASSQNPMGEAGLAACIGHLLAGRRITCAKSTSCIYAEHSLLD